MWVGFAYPVQRRWLRFAGVDFAYSVCVVGFASSDPFG